MSGLSAGDVWSDLPAAVGETPIVGWEHRDALGSALANGFASIGALRVWFKQSR